MKKISVLVVLILALVLVFSCSLTAFAAAEPYISAHPQSGEYTLGQEIPPLSATVDPAGYTILSWKWYTGNGGYLGQVNSTPTCTYNPFINPQPGTYTYYAEVTLRQESLQLVLRPIVLRTDTATIKIKPAESGEQTTPAPNEFRIQKVDENDNPLAGASFQLMGEQHAYTFSSGSDGHATLTGVADGDYVLSEQSAPEGYIKSDDTYEVSVKNGSIWVYIDGAERPYSRVEELVFVNTEKTDIPKPDSDQEIKVRKVDGNNQPLAGAVFELRGADPGDEDYQATSQADGYATFPAIANGTYELSEKAAPSGYNGSSETHTIIVSESGVFLADSAAALPPYTTLIYVNRPIPQLNKDDHFAYMQGYPDGSFGPARNMTRAEAVVMFSRLLSESIDLNTDYRNNYYPDIDQSAWYANQVCYMQQLGVLEDYSRDVRFRPNDPVTRAEFATLAAHFDNLTLTNTNIFSDVSDNHWAVKYINSSAAKGWIVGYPDGTFKPEAYITRAEVVTLVDKILNRSADQSYITSNWDSLPRHYNDLTQSHWAFWNIMEASIGHDFIPVSDEEQWTQVYE